eukprot:COSAG05_NODE_1676_length_4293_cov_41.940391_2_plen_57_part_00
MAQRRLLKMSSMSKFYAEQQDEPDLASFYDGQSAVWLRRKLCERHSFGHESTTYAR